MCIILRRTTKKRRRALSRGSIEHCIHVYGVVSRKPSRFDTSTSYRHLCDRTTTPGVEDVVEAADGWHLFGPECTKEEIVFFCQVIILYMVIVVSIYNLTVGHDDSTLWTALLSSSLGYLLPNPSVKREDGV